MLPALKNLTYYLYIATKHETINCLKKNKRHLSLSVDHIEPNLLHFQKTPESDLIAEEILKEVEEAINNLPARCQLIFRLIKEEGLKYREAAELLDISVKTVETQMSLALSKIMEFISTRFPYYASGRFRNFQKAK
jgi:RNA polymerase sigma-70 factor (ECF subfamily)